MGVLCCLGKLNNIEFRCVLVSIVSGPVILLSAKNIGAVLAFGYFERRKKCPARTLFRWNKRFYNNNVSRRTGEFQEGEKPCFTL